MNHIENMTVILGSTTWEPMAKLYPVHGAATAFFKVNYLRLNLNFKSESGLLAEPYVS